MRAAFIFSVVIFFASTVGGHNTRLAHYVVQVDGERVVCEAKIDLEDLEGVMDDKLNPEGLDSFLQDHLTFQFDGVTVPTELLHMEKTRDWVEIRLSLHTSNINPTDVTVFNSILSEEIEIHDNLMRFIFHDRTRIFRLNKERQQISFSYKKPQR